MAEGLKFTLDLDQKMSGLERAIGTVDAAAAKIEQMADAVGMLESAQKKIKAPKGVEDTKKAATDTAGAFTKLDHEIKAARDELKRLRAPDELVKLKKQLHEIKNPIQDIKESRLDKFGSGIAQGMLGGIAGIASGVAIGQGLVSVFSMVGNVITSAISGLVDMGKEAIAAAGQQERLALSFKQLIGDEPAKALLDDLDQIQGKTALTGGELAELAREFIAAGARAGEVKTLVAGALDMGSIMGGSKEAIQGATMALSDMLRTGVANNKVFKALRISEEDAFADLEKRTGKSQKALQKLMGEGKLDGRDLVESTLGALARKQGGLIGTFADQAGQTLDAKLAHLKDIPGNLFEGLTDSPGYAKLTAFVDKLQSFFGGEMGDKLQGALNRVFDSLAGKLQNIDLERFSAGLIEFLDKLPGRVEMVVGVLEKMLKVAGFLFSGDYLGSEVAKATGSDAAGGAAKAARSTLLDAGVNFLTSGGNPITFLSKTAADAGKNIWQGLAGGMGSGKGGLSAAANDMASAVQGSVESKLQIHSPSKVFERIGEQTAAGFSLGMGNMQSDVEGSMRPMIDIPSPSSLSGPPRAVGMGGVSVTVPININGSASPKETAEEVARILPLHLQSAFDQLRMEFAA